LPAVNSRRTPTPWSAKAIKGGANSARTKMEPPRMTPMVDASRPRCASQTGKNGIETPRTAKHAP